MEPLLLTLEKLAVERARGSGPAHDHLHIRRVAKTAGLLADDERADREVAIAAALLHELWSFPKDHPDKASSGQVCAEHARVVLRGLGCEAGFVDRVAYAIAVHPFSRGVVPETLEARILQDADRLDALGAIGIARCFATCSEMRVPFYAEVDPFCVARAPDEKGSGVGHFYQKLLRVPATLHTTTAKRLADERVEFLRRYLEQLAREIE